MKTQIDLKSALCGLAVGILAMLAIGAETSPNQAGRYQISSGAGISIMLDTQTGQAWAYYQTPPRNDGNFFNAK